MIWPLAVVRMGFSHDGLDGEEYGSEGECGVLGNAGLAGECRGVIQIIAPMPVPTISIVADRRNTTFQSD